MSKSPNDNPGPVHIASAETRRRLHDFVQSAVANLDAALKSHPPEWEFQSKWERGDDGHFRRRERPKLQTWRIFTPNWLQAQAGYSDCAGQLAADALIGPHLDRLVGTEWASQLIEAGSILTSVIHSMRDEHDGLSFHDDTFEREWADLTVFCASPSLILKTVAPLPTLRVDSLPQRLGPNLVIDFLTDEEVTRCCQVGVLQPQSPSFLVIESEIAVGIRWTVDVPKRISTGHEQPGLRNADEGGFGNRPCERADLMLEDVAAILRLFKPGSIEAVGSATWTDSRWLARATAFRVLGNRLCFGNEGYRLSEGDAGELKELWNLSVKEGDRFQFSIRRFSLAFDRGLATDRIVDLVIAAESLFLGDAKERGELSFRCALRAAKFIEHPTYSERDVFGLMRRAYASRSAIVHGGSPQPKDLKLPGGQPVELPIFADAIEELVRLGLRGKTLSMKENAKILRQSDYWEGLVLSGPGGK